MKGWILKLSSVCYISELIVLDVLALNHIYPNLLGKIIFYSLVFVCWGSYIYNLYLYPNSKFNFAILILSIMLSFGLGKNYIIIAIPFITLLLFTRRLSSKKMRFFIILILIIVLILMGIFIFYWNHTTSTSINANQKSIVVTEIKEWWVSFLFTHKIREEHTWYYKEYVFSNRQMTFKEWLSEDVFIMTDGITDYKFSVNEIIGGY